MAKRNKRLLILGCSQCKRDTPGLLPAIERYDGSAYRVLRHYLYDREWPASLSVGVLSAKYGLVGGFTGIELYDERMTPIRAAEWAPICQKTLNEWATDHGSIHLSLGKDYLPAVRPAIESGLQCKTEVFDGPIGIKNSRIKQLLEGINSRARHLHHLTEAGSGKVSYFLPDWDDLLDENFDFEKGRFSGNSREERGDKHCCILMRPKRMCDGILVSLAQHITSKGPLRRILGTEAGSLAPKNLRAQFGLEPNQSLFGDCGAFSYVNEDEPAISVDQAVALYHLHGFDYGASVDHIPVMSIQRNGCRVNLSRNKRIERVHTTIENAETFINLSKQRQASFIPVGTIQALTAEEYASTARLYHEMGYRHLAIGGLVPLPDSLVEDIVMAVMKVVNDLKPRPWVHLFGVFRPRLQTKFRELKVDSFDSATYFRKAWLRSNQNYLAPDGKWYAAIRVPMTSDGRTRKRLESGELDISELEMQESEVMSLLCKYDRGGVSVKKVLNAVIDYDENLTRSSEAQSLREAYEHTLRKRPWLTCDCPFCKNAGIHVLIFRGANRNKRRGAHNTLMLYQSVSRVLDLNPTK
ncbi:MAG: tRNA-guanine transglycosylase DpdA [Candidatus Sumerlaeia bacterium]